MAVGIEGIGIGPSVVDCLLKSAVAVVRPVVGVHGGHVHGHVDLRVPQTNVVRVADHVVVGEPDMQLGGGCFQIAHVPHVDPDGHVLTRHHGRRRGDPTCQVGHLEMDAARPRVVVLVALDHHVGHVGPRDHVVVAIGVEGVVRRPGEANGLLVRFSAGQHGRGNVDQQADVLVVPKIVVRKPEVGDGGIRRSVPIVANRHGCVHLLSRHDVRRHRKPPDSEVRHAEVCAPAYPGVVVFVDLGDFLQHVGFGREVVVPIGGNGVVGGAGVGDGRLVGVVPTVAEELRDWHCDTRVLVVLVPEDVVVRKPDLQCGGRGHLEARVPDR